MYMARGGQKNSKDGGVKFNRANIQTLCLVFGLGALAGCAVAPEGTDIYDPYEPANRNIHNFNKAVDRAALRPAAEAYGDIVPVPVRSSITNAARNWSSPTSILNFVFQGDFANATDKTLAFLMNSTFGIFGLFDIASPEGIGLETSDFGETLAVWGVPEGAYQELPLLGPSTERHTAGRIVDFAINPLSYVVSEDGLRVAQTLGFGRILGDRDQFSATIDGILYESADSYAQSRTLYLQNRRFSLGTPEAEEDVLDELEDLYDDLYQ